MQITFHTYQHLHSHLTTGDIGSGVSGSNVLHVIVVTMGVYNGVVVFVSEERFGVILDTL